VTGCWRRDGDDLLLSVRLTPRSSAARVAGLWTDAKGQAWLSASVTAPPDKGRANAALITLLADAFGIARSSISLEAGETSRLKRVRIMRAAADVAARIDQLARL
jgi:uncharacterized protein (TIGR00251 family)